MSLPHKTCVMVLTLLLCACAFQPNGSLMVDGRERTYTLHLPKGYQKEQGPYPVVVVLHGNPPSGWQMQWYTGMSKTADNNDFIVVYPDAVDGMWKFDDCERMEQEVRYMDRLMAYLIEKYAVDVDRLYFVGISGGSLFLSSLVNAMPEKIAAIGKVAAGRVAIDESCGGSSRAAVPVLFMMGTGDYLYPGDSTRSILSATQTIRYWLERNACSGKPKITDLPDMNSQDDSQVSTFLFESRIGADVYFYRIDEGGHHWPNSRFDARTFYRKRDLGPLNKDFDTNQVLWDFFAQYRR